MNYGLRTTSPTESNHRNLKRHIKDRNIGLQSLFSSITKFVEEKQMQYDELVNNAAIYRPLKIQRHWDIFRDIVNKVSPAALNEIIRQLEWALQMQWASQDGLSYRHCTSRYRPQMGLPCRHELLEKMALKIPVALTDIDIKWHIPTDVVSW